jgi:hypothetical protein
MYGTGWMVADNLSDCGSLEEEQGEDNWGKLAKFQWNFE